MGVRESGTPILPAHSDPFIPETGSEPHSPRTAPPGAVRFFIPIVLTHIGVPKTAALNAVQQK
jgi:hypothetical protein